MEKLTEKVVGILLDRSGLCGWLVLLVVVRLQPGGWTLGDWIVLIVAVLREVDGIEAILPCFSWNEVSLGSSKAWHRQGGSVTYL